MMNNLAREESWDLNPRQIVFLKSRKCYTGDRVPSQVFLPLVRKNSISWKDMSSRSFPETLISVSWWKWNAEDPRYNTNYCGML